MVVISCRSGNINVCTAVISSVQTSLPGFAEFLRIQSIQRRSFPWSVSTTEIVVISSRSRNITVCTAVIAGIDASLVPFSCLVAVK
jgi:hypothetical protein